MRNINLFVEDEAHEDFLTAMVQRFAEDYSIEISIKASSVRGRHGKVITELKQYQRDLQRAQENLPDLIIVGTDSNCTTLLEREKEIEQTISDFTRFVISAIPEPHIERWLLLDSEAFKTVYGKGCPAPDNKCEQDRYKRMLLEAIYDAGTAPLDGIERVKDLVNAMNLQRVAQSDKSIGKLLAALRHQFEHWQK